MGLFKALTRVVASPLYVIKEATEDVIGKNGVENSALSVLTLGASSVVKGIVKTASKSIEALED